MLAAALALLLAPLMMAADPPDSVVRSFSKFQQQMSALPKPMEFQFRRLLIRDLQHRYPDLVRVLEPDPAETDAAIAAIRRANRTGRQSSKTANAIGKRLDQLRSYSNRVDRAALALRLASEIRALPAGQQKLLLTLALGNDVTEQNLGADAVAACVSLLAATLREIQLPPVSDYLELASMIRYRNSALPPPDPALDAALTLLEIRDALRIEARFNLPASDGKTYSLESLRGRVVLLNFWATWCQPCRKEMPDLQKVWERFSSSGLSVLAVSDEKIGTIRRFAAHQQYTFPVISDPERQAGRAYCVDGIPRTFVFDREGRLVAHSEGTTTERQFLEMLKSAGLQ